jgi:hypothetical protein
MQKVIFIKNCKFNQVPSSSANVNKQKAKCRGTQCISRVPCLDSKLKSLINQRAQTIKSDNKRRKKALINRCPGEAHGRDEIQFESRRRQQRLIGNLEFVICLMGSGLIN